MTATPTQTVQTPTPCPLLALRRPGLDWPCDCGGPSSECTKDKDGHCG